MKLKSIFILIATIPLFAFSMHKYYVGLTEIEYIPKKNDVQIIVSVFIDDLEKEMDSLTNKTLNIGTKQENPEIKSEYINYLKNHFSIKINQTEIDYNYIGEEYEGNIAKFYLEIEDVHSFKSIEISNTILFQTFPNQKNIIKFKNEDYNKTLFLTKNNPKGLLKF